MIAEQRWCRTTDGRLVPETHPDAAFLAYSVGKEISAADAELLAPPAPEPAAEPEAKQLPPAANKARKPGANKSGGTS